MKEEFEYAIKTTTLRSGVVHYTPLTKKVRKKWWHMKEDWIPIHRKQDGTFCVIDVDELNPLLETQDEALWFITKYKAQVELEVRNDIKQITISQIQIQNND